MTTASVRGALSGDLTTPTGTILMHYRHKPVGHLQQLHYGHGDTRHGQLKRRSERFKRRPSRYVDVDRKKRVKRSMLIQRAKI